MIVKKTWEKFVRKGSTRYNDVYTGYFLLGFVPLYVSRERFKL